MIHYRRKDKLRFTEAEKLVGDAIRAGFEPLGDQLLQDLKTAAPVDRGKFKGGVRKRISGRGLATRMLIFNNADHAEYVEKGREPGKPPPSDTILGWVRRKGLGASAFSLKTRRAISAGTKRSVDRKAGKRRAARDSLLVIQKSIAFLISRAIGKRGLKGKFFFRDLRSKQAAKISAAISGIKVRVAQILNN